MTKHGIPVSPELLRGYLDFTREVHKRETESNYAKRLVVTANRPFGHNTELFRTAIEHGYLIIADGKGHIPVELRI